MLQFSSKTRNYHCPNGCTTPAKGQPRTFTSFVSFVKHIVDEHREVELILKIEGK
jgi:hypothetical protein